MCCSMYKCSLYILCICVSLLIDLFPATLLNSLIRSSSVQSVLQEGEEIVSDLPLH